MYKGRWKGAMVAVKVIEHNESVASRLEGLRESVLSANIQHPNVVRGPTAPGFSLQSSCCEAAHACIACSTGTPKPGQVRRIASCSVHVYFSRPACQSACEARHKMPNWCQRAIRHLCRPAIALDLTDWASDDFLQWRIPDTETCACS